MDLSALLPHASTVFAAGGGYFWGRALLLRSPEVEAAAPRTIGAWNQQSLWKSRAPELGSAVCFAEDALGVQFVHLEHGRVGRWDPELGRLDEHSQSVEEWVAKMIADPQFETAEGLLRRWEASNGALPVGHRLVPKQLFILGGEYEPSNLIAKPELEALMVRLELREALRDVPDGTNIVLRPE